LNPPKICTAKLSVLQKLAQCRSFCRIILAAFGYDNIAVEPDKIRLLIQFTTKPATDKHCAPRTSGNCSALRRTNEGGLTASPRGNIADLHATARQRTIGKIQKARVAGIFKVVTGLSERLVRKK
jgi:hypothetical protein